MSQADRHRNTLFITRDSQAQVTALTERTRVMGGF
jgi:hypothetical protein